MATDRRFQRIERVYSPLLSERVQQALASLSLEGIELSSDALRDVQKLDVGKMSKEDFLKSAIRRAKS